MSSIKLTADSGGGTFEVKAPSSSSNTRVLTLPDTGNLTLNPGHTGPLQVLEEFFVPCDGTAVTTAQGSVSIQNVTAAQDVPASMTTCTGSEISYQPPTNTKIVIYTFAFAYTYKDDQNISAFELQLDGTRVGKRPNTVRGYNNNYQPIIITHPFRIEPSLSADPDVGRVQSWSSAKTIRIQMRYWANNYEGAIHKYGEAIRASDGSFENNQFSIPCVGIKSIGSV